MAIVKRRDKPRLSEDLQRQQKDHIERGQHIYSRTGILGDVGYRTKPVFVDKPSRKIIDGVDNAAVIIIDNDPTYSAAGGDFASRIQIVAGVSGSHLRADETVDDLTPLHDAAGIYISQKGDPQMIFGDASPLANPAYALFGNAEDLPAEVITDTVKSHVTTCADTIQIIGKNGGVNIYAGGVGAKLSTGIPNREYMGVNLIYGNKADYAYSDSPYSLQPLVKGHNLEKALSAIIERVDDLNNTVFGLMLTVAQLEINAALHTHVVVAPPILPVPIGLAVPSIEMVVGSAIRAPQHVKTVLKNITTAVNNVISEVNQSSLTTAGINSRFNKTN